MVVNILKRSIQVVENNALKLNCFHYAGINGHLSIVQFLVEDFKMDIHLKDGEGNSVTYLSTFHKKLNVSEYLVAKGGDLRDKKKGLVDGLKARYQKEFPGKTPLVCACELGRLEDVKVLITGYNDVNGSNGNNNNNMTLKEYVNQVGKSINGGEYIKTFNPGC